jgi:hypothetical protein
MNSTTRHTKLLSPSTGIPKPLYDSEAGSEDEDDGGDGEDESTAGPSECYPS